MGAWDATAFGNDEAADWALELLAAEKPAEFVANTLLIANVDGYLEATSGGRAVAAAAVVAAACGGATQSLPNDLAEWLPGKEAPLSGLAPHAVAAIERVAGQHSELRDLWQETDDFLSWRGELDAMLAALNQVS